MASYEELSEDTSRETSLGPLISTQTVGKARCSGEQEVGVVESGRLKLHKLLSILKGYGEYPAKYR